MVRDSRESLVSQPSLGAIPEVSSKLMSRDASGSMCKIVGIDLAMLVYGG